MEHDSGHCGLPERTGPGVSVSTCGHRSSAVAASNGVAASQTSVGITVHTVVPTENVEAASEATPKVPAAVGPSQPPERLAAEPTHHERPAEGRVA
jgi:hypothetical protein